MNSLADLLALSSFIEDNMYEADSTHIFVYQYKVITVFTLSDNGLLLSFADETHTEISIPELSNIRIFTENKW